MKWLKTFLNSLKLLLKKCKNYFNNKIENEPILSSNIVIYPCIHLGITDKTEKISYNLDFRYNVRYKTNDNVKVTMELLPGYLDNKITDLSRSSEDDNISIALFINEYKFDLSKLNRSKLIPNISEEFSKYNHIYSTDPNKIGIKIKNEEFRKNLYYPKFVDILDSEFYNISEIYDHLLGESNNISVSTNINDKYFLDESFLLIESILRRNLPQKYCDIIDRMISENNKKGDKWLR